jgi:hypothetical protein
MKINGVKNINQCLKEVPTLTSANSLISVLPIKKIEDNGIGKSSKIFSMRNFKN